MLMRHAIGSVLRRLRTERGATLRELSESSRISVPYLSEIERGRKEASSEILAALCRVLDVTERELLSQVVAEFARVEVLSLLPERSPATAEFAEEQLASGVPHAVLLAA
ncbi:helix-turn-helix transcriptional regulator [Leifsonia shinshuensis]|uniref:helix-turn-helix domain-containing protein n=1 Tax=Leifsonia shinshuensis TaxID=150026 RepID=UPI002414EB5A|nr:helix-turn-helix transcriptional regulator [Leifsonia shinshuensis]MCI0157810.1 helix-turn-helix transcriptional regulator [Leifsonia shinshuensis]